MGDSIELTLDYPIPDADWDKIMDVEFENTKSITFRTKSGKTVEFAKVSEEFEWCHDCKEYDQEKHCCHRWTKVIRNTVEELKQERPKGKWIKMSDSDGVYWACSECGENLPRVDHFDPQFDLFPKLKSIDKTKYCPNCGSPMEGEEDNGTD